MELIGAITDAERQIDEQISRLQSYQSEIELVQRRVDAALSGSTAQHGNNMIDQLTRTKQQISDTIGRLQIAKEKLTQVRMI
jgi:flagellar biosynthesis chaperone FliJ